MRFRWRDLLIPTVILAVLYCFFFPASRTKSLWIGHADVTLDFVLIDADSERPIDGAAILLRDADFLSDPPEVQRAPYRLQVKSGLDGHARIIVSLQVYGADDDSWIKYPDWQLDASADGYKALTVTCDEFRGSYIADRHYHSELVPPPIVVPLRRQGR